MASSRSQFSAWAFQRPGLLGKKDWLPVTPSPTSPPPSSNKRPTLTVATLNVWFDRKHSEARFPAILNHVLTLAADIICLQEVNSQFLATLRAHRGIREKYGYFGGSADGADITDETFYGCLILFNRDTVSLDSVRVHHNARSNQGRHLLYAAISGRRGKSTEGLTGFTVGTSHVESPVTGDSGQAERQHQLEEAKAILTTGRGAIFCGDTNVLPHDEAIFPASLDWWRDHDLWLRSGQPTTTPTYGITYPVNQQPERLDRMFMLDASVPYEVVRAATFGADRMFPPGDEYDGEQVYLSDHIGVVATVRLGGGGQS